MTQVQKKNSLILEIVAIGLLGFLGIVIETALNIAFPFLSSYFRVSPAQVQWLTTGYMLVSTVLIPMSAWLRKRISVVTLFRISVVMFSVGTIVAAVSNNYVTLLSGRLLQGISNGIALPLMFSVILREAPREKLGRLIGVGSLVIAFAPAVGPIFGGLVQTYLSWRAIFWLVLPLVLIAWLLGERSIPRIFTPSAAQFDFVGATLLSVFLITSMLLLVNVTAGQINSGLSLIYAVLTVVSGVLFVRITYRSDNPILDLRLFTQRIFVFCLLGFFLLQCLSLSMSYLVPNVLQMAFHQSPDIAGLMVLPAAIIDAVTSAVAGYVYDKTVPRFTILSGACLVMLGFISIFFIPMTPISLAIIYAIFMFGLGASYANVMTYALGKLSQSKTDDGNAIFMTAQAYAGAIGIAVAASLISFAQVTHGQTVKATLYGLRLNSWYLAVTAVVVLILLILGTRGKTVE